MRIYTCKQCNEQKKMYGVKGPMRTYCDECRSKRHAAYLKKRDERLAMTEYELPRLE
jgi:hypothetical protein